MILGPFSNVFAKLSTRVNDIEVEDCAALSIEIKIDISYKLNYTWSCK